MKIVSHVLYVLISAYVKLCLSFKEAWSNDLHIIRSTALTDVVIGCDGVKSRTRHILLGDNEITLPTFSEKYAYRGLIPMEKAVEALGEELARNSQMYLGYHGHILTFPSK